MLKSILVSLALATTILFVGYSLPPTKSDVPLKVQYNNLNASAKKQVECLADNIFFESAHEPTEGKIAVAFVTLNRLNSGHFANSICSVVKQKTQNVCQFSWYCQEKENRLSYNKLLTRTQEMIYNEILEIAVYVYTNYEKMKDPTQGALFYHADYVNPGWKNMKKTAVIGRHIFYTRKDLI